MSTKIKCLLLDDELPGLTYLRMMCEQSDAVEVVRAFNDPEKFIQELPQLEYDLCVLDIEMPHLNGLEVAKLLNGKPVIFTTAYRDYAAEAFDLNAIDYIRKPIQKERLDRAFKKAAEQLRSKPEVKNFIRLNSSQGKSLLFFDQVLYISVSPADKRDKIAYLKNGQSLLLKNISFDALLASLPAKEFCRVNKKEVLALKTVAHFNHEEITSTIMINGKALRFTLSEIYKSDFLLRTAG